MLISEGYRGFQKQFSPRVAARIGYLAKHGKPLELLLAPLFCMGYFRGTRRLLITVWALTAGIIILVLLIRLLQQPWRGIIDGGVVLGLSYGLLWIYIFIIRMIKSRSYPIDPQVP